MNQQDMNSDISTINLLLSTNDLDYTVEKLLENYKSLLEEKLKLINFINIDCRIADNLCCMGVNGTNFYLTVTTERIFTNDEMYKIVKEYFENELQIKENDEFVKIAIADDYYNFKTSEFYDYLKERVSEMSYKKHGNSFISKIRILFDNQGYWPDNVYMSNDGEHNL